jgi:hypothetical protein
MTSAEMAELLRDTRITVTEEGEDWLMMMVRPRHKPKGPYRVKVSKALVPADRIEAHARITFACLLQK